MQRDSSRRHDIQVLLLPIVALVMLFVLAIAASAPAVIH